MIYLQDELVNLDDLTEIEDRSLFSFEQMPVRPYEKDQHVIMEVRVEKNCFSI